jgi:hypothetical protein
MKTANLVTAICAFMAGIGALLFSGNVIADQVKADYLSYQGGYFDTNLNNGGAGRFTFDRDALTNGGDEYQGILNVNGGPNVLAGDDDVFYGFCLEPNQYLKDPETYNVVDLEAAPENGFGPMDGRADDLRLLFGNVYPDFSQAIDDLIAKALQIAVWEIANENVSLTYDVINDGGADTTVGAFWVNNQYAARDKAQEWLDKINRNEWTKTVTNLVALADVGDNNQDYVVQVVPLPAAAWLFISAVAGAAAVGRRRRKEEAPI